MSRKISTDALAIGITWLYAQIYEAVLVWFNAHLLTGFLLRSAEHLGGSIVLRLMCIGPLVTLLVSAPFAMVIAYLHPQRWLVVAASTAGWLARLLLPILTYLANGLASTGWSDLPSRKFSIQS